MAKTDLTAAEIRDLAQQRLNYDPHTGVFTWRNRCPSSRAVVGAPLRNPDRDGYFRVRLADRTFKLHRLAWLWVHGVWPTHMIDHIDGNRTNNAIANLRDVPLSINRQNMRAAMRHNTTTGVLGVSKNRDHWVARIYFEGRQRCKCYPTLEEARAAYLEAKRAHHPGNTL